MNCPTKNSFSTARRTAHRKASHLSLYLGLCCLMIFWCVATNLSLWAQSQAINATIRGRVLDPDQAAIPAASVTVVNDATGFMRSVDSGADGYYVIPNLPLGSYTVTVKKDGFTATSHPGVALAAGTDVVIDIQLKVGAVSTEIQVTGGVPILDPARVNIGRTIDTREVENLPLPSRNPYNFILFQPGISGHPNPELGIPRTINTNGLMDRINYQMDGMVDTQSDRYGLRLFPISDVYVREVQTVANSYAPEFGGTSGNIFNVVTNSGTNDFHGMFQYIRRSVDASARPILLSPTAAKPELKLTSYIVNGGGPLIKDKLFLFAGYEHLTRGVPFATTIKPVNATALGIPSSLLATAPGLLHGQFFDVRLDWNIDSRNQMFLRYNYFRNEFPFNTNVGGLNALDASSDFRDRAHVIGTQIVSTISPNLLNEFRFSWPYRSNTHFAGPVTGKGPQISIPGVANFGGSVGAGDVFAEKIPSFNENLTYIRGTHTFKTGLGMSKIVDLQQDDTFSQYTFPSIASYLSAVAGTNRFGYTTFRSRTDITGVHYGSFFWNFFVQDNWQLTPNLLLIFGVRYDRFQSPDANPNAPFVFSRNFNNPAGNWAPRLGFALRLDSKTVLRSSAGIFYDAPPTNLWFNSLNQDGSNRTLNTLVSPTSPGAPAFPQVLSLAQPQDVVTVTPNFRDAHTINYSLQITRELTPNDAITAGYVFTGGRQLEFLRNINLINPIATLADGRPVFSSTVSAATRLFPQFNNISLQDVGANSSYHAFLLTYQHRWAQGFQVNASYTFSHTITDAPEVNSFEQNLPIQDPTNRRRDRGNSSVNRPHSLTISAVLEPKIGAENPVLKRILNDNQFTLLVNTSSGDEQNVRANKILNGDATTSGVTRPLFIGRNTVRGPAIYQVDLRYTRTIVTLWERIRPQFFLEANNLFNHPNITSLNTVLPVNAAGFAALPSAFPATSTVLEGRIVQFGVAVRW